MPEQDDTQPIWERLKQEPANWYSRFLLYRNMPSEKRTLLGAVRLYQEKVAAKSGKQQKKKPVAKVPGSWSQACDQWDWKFRAEQYTAHLQAEQEVREAVLRQMEADEIERIMSTGYAATHKRIEALSAMADLIKLSFIDEDEGKDKIKFAWVTPDKIREFRGCLDDIAKELGARVKRQEVTGKNGSAIEFVTEWGGGALEDDESGG